MCQGTSGFQVPGYAGNIPTCVKVSKQSMLVEHWFPNRVAGPFPTGIYHGGTPHLWLNAGSMIVEFIPSRDQHNV